MIIKIRGGEIMNLILLGLPGAGKGTQAKNISQDFDLPHIATGDVFRSLIEKETPLGKKALEYIKKGKLVPDEEAIKLLEGEFAKIDIDSGFVLDGFPRTLYQAKILTKKLNELNRKIDIAFYIDVNPEELVERLAGRRVCINCGNTYHIKHNPPQNDGKCNFCENDLIQRKDDQEGTVRKRIQIHINQINELISYYKNKEVLKTVSGENINEIHGKIKKAIEVELI